MENIPTAEELLFDYSVNDVVDNLDEQSKELIGFKVIEFAKLHVKAALEAAEKSNFINAKGISISPKSNKLHWTAYGSIGEIIYNKDTILNSYPLNNIK